ncbi:MAG: cupin domain-containing protein [Microcella pacifica]
MSRSHVTPLAQAFALGPPPAGMLSIPVFTHGSLDVRLYAPAGADRQTPHERDEAYVVARGEAEFVGPDGARSAVAAGSFVFVAAGETHRFENLSADFAAWVLFYGPTGGERDATS